MKNNILLIGCGLWGRNILSILLAAECRVTVVDPDPEPRQQALAMGAIDSLANIPLGCNFDGVIIASPSSSHLTDLLHVMPCKIPVLVEKPIVTDVCELGTLIENVHNNVFPMHVWQYHAGVQTIRDIVVSGEIGGLKAIYSTRANWTSPRCDVDTLWNLVPHDLSIAQLILGYIPEPKYAVAEVYGTTIRAAQVMLGGSTDLPFMAINVSNRYETKIRELRVNCEGGIAVMKMNNEGEYVKIISGTDTSELVSASVETKSFDKTPALNTQITTFLSFLNGVGRPKEKLEDAFDIVRCIDKISTLIN